MYFLEASEFSLRMFEGFHFNGHMKFGGAESPDLIQHYLVPVLIAWCHERWLGDPGEGQMTGTAKRTVREAALNQMALNHSSILATIMRSG